MTAASLIRAQVYWRESLAASTSVASLLGWATMIFATLRN
jgi:hypothetical protein